MCFAQIPGVPNFRNYINTGGCEDMDWQILRFSKSAGATYYEVTAGDSHLSNPDPWVDYSGYYVYVWANPGTVDAGYSYGILATTIRACNSYGCSDWAYPMKNFTVAAKPHFTLKPTGERYPYIDTEYHYEVDGEQHPGATNTYDWDISGGYDYTIIPPENSSTLKIKFHDDEDYIIKVRGSNTTPYPTGWGPFSPSKTVEALE